MAEFLDDSIDFTAYLKESDASTKVRPASSWIGNLKDKLRNNGAARKVYLPWDKTRTAFHFRPGEVSLWSGQNGHGKSLVTSQVGLSLMGQDDKVCVASFEMKPEATLQRMARMYCQTNPYSPEFQQGEGMEALVALYDEFGEWSDGRLWLYDQHGTARPDVVIGMARYCATELGINHVIVDNLAKCIAAEDDYNGQKSFVDELTAVARDTQCHIHLVHHLKKPKDESEVPDKHSNKGSGAITDLVDNVWMVWRNKPKEDDIKTKGSASNKRTEPDQYLLCRKQRNYDGSEEGEPTVGLWFHRDSQQYLADPNDQPMLFINYPHRATL